MQTQKKLRNKMIRKYGCHFLCHLFYFEARLNRRISEEDINKIYEVAVKEKAMKKNCFIWEREKLLAIAGAYFGKKTNAKFIGFWKEGIIDMVDDLAAVAYEKYKKDKESRFLIQEYRTPTGNQHFVVVATDGTLLYDSYPNSPYVCAANKRPTRLYWVGMKV